MKERKKHVKAVHEQPKELSKCNECDKEFKFPSQLRMHAKIHEKTPQPPQPEFFHCEDCDFKSRRKWSLQRHEKRWHEAKKPTMFTTLQLWTLISKRLMSLNHGVQFFKDLKDILGNDIYNIMYHQGWLISIN